MTNDLGVWTAEDCALVLIDYQNEMFEVIRSETNADLVELHVRLLAKTAKAFNMPIVLSTVGVRFGFNGPTLPSVLSELDGIEQIDRSAPRSSGSRTPVLSLQRPSRSSPSCSGTGRRRWPGRLARSSTGTSTRSARTPTRSASPRRSSPPHGQATDMSGRLAGKVRLVTGTGGSMGRATALAFAAAGAAPTRTQRRRSS